MWSNWSPLHTLFLTTRRECAKSHGGPKIIAIWILYCVWLAMKWKRKKTFWFRRCVFEITPPKPGTRERVITRQNNDYGLFFQSQHKTPYLSKFIIHFSTRLSINFFCDSENHLKIVAGFLNASDHSRDKFQWGTCVETLELILLVVKWVVVLVDIDFDYLPENR